MTTDNGAGDDIRVTIGGSVSGGGQVAAGRNISIDLTELSVPILQLLAQHPPTSRSHLFDFSTDRVNAVLKRIIPGLTSRSLRRGPLSFLNEKGHTLKELALLSGHRSDLALRRYLAAPVSSESNIQIALSRQL